MLSHLSRVENFPAIFALVLLLLTAAGCPSRYHDTADSRNTVSLSSQSVNINTATAAELEALPNIGPTLAQRIVDFREAHGRFRRPEHLLLVQGISEKRFREIRALLRTE